MKKREYEKPYMEVVEMATSQMIVSSSPDLKFSPEDYVDENLDALGKERNGQVSIEDFLW